MIAGCAIYKVEIKGMFMEHVIGCDALYRSMCKCRKGVSWKDSVASYILNGLERTYQLNTELCTGTYIPRKPVHFRVTSPKPRGIASVCFRDRVYQRSLNDNEIYPIMTKSFIYDNFACQKGKGTDAARNRLKAFLHRHYRKHGTDGYVAQFDISGYYPNMSHEVTEELFASKLSAQSAHLAIKILHDQYEGDRGYNPGSQLVQIAGISFLDKLDHYIKEHLRAKLYLRYMDDFIIIHEDKAYLEKCKEEIGAELSRVGFHLNPKKTRVFPLHEGIEFLGFTFRLTYTGKVLMCLLSDNVRRQRRKLRRLVKKSKNGYMPKHKVDEAYAAWRNHASKGDTFKLVARMDGYYKELWNAEDN